MDKICPYCQGQHLIKNGSAYGVPTRRAAPAKWRCKDCLRQTSFKPPRGEPLWKKETAVLLYTLGLSMNASTRGKTPGSTRGKTPGKLKPLTQWAKPRSRILSMLGLC